MKAPESESDARKKLVSALRAARRRIPIICDSIRDIGTPRDYAREATPFRRALDKCYQLTRYLESESDRNDAIDAIRAVANEWRVCVQSAEEDRAAAFSRESYRLRQEERRAAYARDVESGRTVPCPYL